jgi:acid phosphatase family membrane protein YuiD
MPFLLAATAVVTAALACFLLKGFTSWKNEGVFRPLGLGGMPSAHATGVAALGTAVFLESGWSLLFLVVGVFGFLVVRDACGVRWEVTRHSEALNKLTRSKTYNRTGHTRWEAFVGVLLGVIVTLVVYAFLA